MEEPPKELTNQASSLEEEVDPFAYRKDRPPLPPHTHEFGVLSKERGSSLGDE